MMLENLRCIDRNYRRYHGHSDHPPRAQSAVPRYMAKAPSYEILAHACFRLGQGISPLLGSTSSIGAALPE